MKSHILGLMLLAAAGVLAGQTNAPQLLAPGVISRPDSYESFGSLSPDGQEFYFTIHRENFGGQRIVVSRLSGTQWSAPTTLAISGTFNDREPKLSPDGRRLYFSSNRPVGNGETTPQRRLDLWMAERASAGDWGPARHLDAPVNSDVHEFCPVVTSNGMLYFISARTGGIRGPEPTDLYNVWRAKPTDASGLRFAEPENLGRAINSGFETNVYVSPDETLMLVSRDGAPDSLGGDDLYASRFGGGAWRPMRHLPAPINSDKYEYGPSVSPDGKWLIFTSARAGTADIYRMPIDAIGR